MYTSCGPSPLLCAAVCRRSVVRQAIWTRLPLVGCKGSWVSEENEVVPRSRWEMRSPPSQRGKWGRPSFLIENVLSVNAYIAQCFAIVLLQCISHRVICRAVRAKLSTDWVKSSRFSEEMRSSLVPGCISLPKLLCHVSVTVLEW